MLDGLIKPAVRDYDYILPAAPYPVIPSGVSNGQSTLYRYSIPTDEQPTLTIIDYIPDRNGNFIKPGHYELSLSTDKEFMYILESKNVIASIPVFKLEENESEVLKYQELHRELSKAEQKERKKAEKKKKKEDRIQKIIDTKYAKTGATIHPKEYIHMEASIDYIKEGGYYLIRYEKGCIRAFGAIKI